MDIGELAGIVKETLKPHGYHNKRYLYWRKREELTTLVHLQKSRWDDGIYINFGVTPSAMITKSEPPPTGHWARELRGEGTQGPHREVFRLLASAQAAEVTADQCRAAMRWLAEWIDVEWGDAARLRERTLVESRQDDWGILEDWARGKLRVPTSYFEGARYYS